jgi:hypothetical protein
MVAAIIKILIGLFIWLVLPSLIKTKRKNKGLKKFISVSCLILGLAIIIFGSIDLLNSFLNLNL